MIKRTQSLQVATTLALSVIFVSACAVTMGAGFSQGLTQMPTRQFTRVPAYPTPTGAGPVMTDTPFSTPFTIPAPTNYVTDVPTPTADEQEMRPDRTIEPIEMALQPTVTPLTPVSPTPTVTPNPERPVVLRMAYERGITSLDPLRLSPTDRPSREIVENVFVGLTRLDPVSGDVVPMLATDWEISPDGLEWVFHLRDDVYWVRPRPDGEIEAIRPVVAGDFVAAIRRACSPTNSISYATGIYMVSGCQEARMAEPDDATDAWLAARIEVDAPDETTVRYRLAFPGAYFLTITAMPEFRPIPQEYLWEGLPGEIPVVNGPWVPVEWEPGEGITLVRNPFWPDPPGGNLERVEIRWGEYDVAGAFTAGELDMAYLSEENFERLQSVAPDAVYDYALPSVVLIGFSQERFLTRSVELRRAFAWAIDRQRLADEVLQGRGQPITHMVPPGMVAGPPDDDLGHGYDPESARSQLANAGYEECDGLPEQVRLIVDYTEQSQAIARFLVRAWMGELGCDGTMFYIREKPFDYVLSVARGDVTIDYAREHVWLVSWSADYWDAANWLADTLHCEYGAFDLGAECGEVDSLLDEAGMIGATATRSLLYARVEEMLFGDDGTYPVVPLYVATVPTARQSWLTGPLPHGPVWWGGWYLDMETMPTD